MIAAGRPPTAGRRGAPPSGDCLMPSPLGAPFGPGSAQVVSGYDQAMPDTAAATSSPRELDPFYVELGRILRSHRARRGLMITDVAAAVELHKSTLGSYERGERRPTVPALQRLAAFYDVEPGDLMPRTGAEAREDAH